MKLPSICLSLLQTVVLIVFANVTISNQTILVILGHSIGKSLINILLF
jgi:hypothetical protein